MNKEEALEIWKAAIKSNPYEFASLSCFEPWWVKYSKDHNPGMDTDEKHLHTHNVHSSNNKATGWIDATEELPPENEDVICREYGSDHVLVIHWSSDQTMHEGMRSRTKYEFISQVKEWKRLPWIKKKH